MRSCTAFPTALAFGRSCRPCLFFFSFFLHLPSTIPILNIQQYHYLISSRPFRPNPRDISLESRPPLNAAHLHLTPQTNGPRSKKYPSRLATHALRGLMRPTNLDLDFHHQTPIPLKISEFLRLVAITICCNSYMFAFVSVEWDEVVGDGWEIGGR